MSLRVTCPGCRSSFELQDQLRGKWSLSRFIVLGLALAATASPARAQYVQAQLSLTQLPQEHAYQRTLRDFIGTLTEKDLAVERLDFKIADGGDPEEQYRLWLLTLNLPRVQAAALPAAGFTLKSLESAKGLALPAAPLESQMLAWLAAWNQAGNPYHGSKPLKLRAFVLAAVDLMMLDYLYEHEPQGANRADFLGGNLIWIGYTARTVKDVLPAEVRAAFDAGLKKHILRLSGWGPRGAMTDMDLFAPVGLWYCMQAVDDAEVKRVVEAYARRLFTDERFFHPAGYFVDVGCFDTSYNGISLYFATWAALASDWKFAQEAVAKAYRLRAHLCLPEADGKSFQGPSHMSSRTSADPPHDQWNFPHRPYAAAMATDEALHLAPLPAANVMRNAPAQLNHHLNGIMTAKPAETKPQPWKESHWSGTLNFAYDHYQKGYYARRLKLEQEASPLLKPLYLRDERFIHEFDKAFLIARFDGYAAVVHTGPIRGWPNGLAGGALSAFWTPATGPALLGRRRGMQGPVRDTLDEWRLWPVHAVSGTTAGGEFFTSANIKKPEAKYDISDKKGEAIVTGPIAVGKETMPYQRRFLLEPNGLTIHTSLQTQKTKLAELYETLPVYLADHPKAKDVKVLIQLQVGEQWHDATPQPQTNVKAIRIERRQGAVVITLDRPRTVQLAPHDWTDGFQTRVNCQTILVDLLGGKAKEGDGIALSYTIAPAAEPKR